MLCDDITNDTYFQGLYDGLPLVVQKIAHAQKFVLTPEFCLAADGLVENVPELDKVVPMCRIPYPLTWIEFLHDDRPHWDPAGPHGRGRWMPPAIRVLRGVLAFCSNRKMIKPRSGPRICFGGYAQLLTTWFRKLC